MKQFLRDLIRWAGYGAIAGVVIFIGLLIFTDIVARDVAARPFFAILLAGTAGVPLGIAAAIITKTVRWIYTD